MAHGHDAHGHDAHGHDTHGHDAHAAPPAAPAPTPAHVFTIAKLTRWLGLAMTALGFVAAWGLLLTQGWVPFFTAAFVSLYGLCIFLAARHTLATA